MKQILFFFAMLASVATSAQTLSAKITKIDYATKIVTCDLSWTGRNTTHLSDVWVFVDYLEVSNTNTTITGSWAPAAITGATVTQNTTGSAVASTVSGNTRGVWVKSTTSGANFTGQVALQLSSVPAKFNACAYATDYPPNVTANNGSYTFHGTLPFTLTAADGATTQTIPDKIIPTAVVTITPVTLTDRTGCPGVFCIYAGADLYIDATHLCQQRATGAHNWEAWIKDARDNKIYRIAQLSTGLWTMDDYLNYKGHAAALTTSCSTADPNGTEYDRVVLKTTYTTLCPTGWRLPAQSEFEQTVADWLQYLNKTFAVLGETCYSTYSGWICQAGYTSFIVSTCLTPYLTCYGERITGINAAGAVGTQIGCYGYNAGDPVAGYHYSGYVRCVR
jgi:hypothetical protein